MSEYRKNPDELKLSEIMDLRNQDDGGKGPLGRSVSVGGAQRKSLVEHVQCMLKDLKEYDLGTSGSANDGIDGKFGKNTEEAVKKFQRSHKDWEGKQLKEDGLVGPKTADALNRAMVGVWYKNCTLHIITTKDELKKSILINPKDAKRAKIVIALPHDIKRDRGPEQLMSWFDEYGSPRFGEGIVGQIFFSTDVSTFDEEDRSVLKRLIESYSILLLGNKIHLKFVGHADERGTVDYNYKLGLKRAQSVQTHLDKLKQQYLFFSSDVSSKGEQQSTRNHLAGDRRVDIISSYIPRRPPIQLPPVKIKGEYTGPLSWKFKFRTILGSSVNLGPIGGQVISIVIKNSRTNRQAYYTYTGAGPGLGFSINRPTGWEEKEIRDKKGETVWLDVDDFEGNGSVGSIGVGYGGTVFIFKGPKERGRSNESVSVTFDGWDINVGFEADAVGFWHKR